MLACAQTNERDTEAFRDLVESEYSSAVEQISREVFVVTGGAILDRLPRRGEKEYAVIQLVGFDARNGVLRFHYHGDDPDPPLGVLQMVRAVGTVRRMGDGTSIARVEVVFDDTSTARQKRQLFESLGAAVVMA